MTKNIVLIILSILLLSCQKDKKIEQDFKEEHLQYAKNLKIKENEHSILIESNGNSLVLNKKELPFKSIMVETVAGISFLDELNALQTIKGVVDANFIYNPKIREQIQSKSILEIGNANELYVELILKNKPQLIIASTNPVLAKYHQQLEENGIKILYLDEYLENDPLARVEYLKVFGKILNQNEFANQRFNSIQKKYDSIQTIIHSSKNTKTVLLNTMYGDVWYLPSKNQLQAKVIEDAKGKYIFDDKVSENALNLSFEEVYAKAKDAEIWFNTSFNSLDQMKAANQNYTWFTAFKNKNIYNSDKRSLPSGAQDYFEQGILRPDIILNDLGKILHPELFPNYDLYFYRKLQ